MKIKLAVCAIPVVPRDCPKGSSTPTDPPICTRPPFLAPNAANCSNRDVVLLIVPQFHVMAWGFPYMCVLTGADMVMPSLHLQPEALIDMLQKEKITKANGVPTIWLGVYEAMKKKPSQGKAGAPGIFGGRLRPTGQSHRRL